MNVLLWTLSTALLLLCTYLSMMNWGVFVNNYILKKKWASAIPMIGGFSGVLGVLLIPLNIDWPYSLLPLLLDWGSLPVLVVSLILSLKGK